ncbi:MAG: glycosyl transferase family 2 [Proteobacteria bacterium]|nr:glycosyl transferase family 2 [Pseudomonadota bacterium]
MRFAVVIPAYNEAATIRDLAERALRICAQVIVVDDGSTDDTARTLDGLAVRLLRNDRNLGKAASLWRGALEALTLGAEVVVTMDGDGQHAPEDIPRLIARHAIPKLRYFGNRVAVFWLSWACGQRLDDSQSGFRAYPAELFRKVRISHDRQHGFVFESEILIEAARHGHRCVMVPIAAVYQSGGRASYFRQRDTLRIIRMVAWKLLSRGLYLQGFARAFLNRTGN